MNIQKYTVVFLVMLSGWLMSCQNNTVHQSKTVDASPSEWFKKYKLEKINLPKGYAIDVYAEVPNARSITLSPNEVLYVGNKSENNVYAVVDSNKDGKADKIYTIATGLNSPNGVAFKDGNLYIATISSIVMLPNIEANLSNPPKPIVVYDKFPKENHHGWKFIAFGPDGKLYVPVGAPCNNCESKNPIFASITRMNVDGTEPEIYAQGVRNTVGFTWHPTTKDLWFTDNGRDMMGDDIPGDELNSAANSGLHFGYPYCQQGNIIDPEFGKGKNCTDYIAPKQILGAHVASLGLRFYTGKMFDSSTYQNQIFIAEHGSWNRSKPIGYRVSLVTIDEKGNVKSYTSFADGWLQPDGTVLGRPVDIEVMQDGSLLVSDDYSGVIYRITKT